MPYKRYLALVGVMWNVAIHFLRGQQSSFCDPTIGTGAIPVHGTKMPILLLIILKTYIQTNGVRKVDRQQHGCA